MTTPQDHGPVQMSIDKIRAEMERLVDMARDRGGRALDAVGIKNLPRPEFPAVDVAESNDAVHLVADIPGVDPDLLDINVTGQILRIRGTIAPSPHTQDGSLHRRERAVGPFERTLTLPCGVDADASHADLKHGVLHVRLPKAANEVGHKIPVQAVDIATV